MNKLTNRIFNYRVCYNFNELTESETDKEKEEIIFDSLRTTVEMAMEYITVTKPPTSRKCRYSKIVVDITVLNETRKSPIIEYYFWSVPDTEHNYEEDNIDFEIVKNIGNTPETFETELIFKKHFDNPYGVEKDMDLIKELKNLTKIILKSVG